MRKLIYSTLCFALLLSNGLLAQETTTIESEQAIELMNNYKKANAEKVFGYTVGKDILSEIVNLKEVDRLQLFFGADDEGSEKIIYQAFNDENKALGPYGDDGVDCPPNCPPKEDPEENVAAMSHYIFKENVAAIGHYISEETAINWISNYKGKVKAYSVSINAIISLLDQPEASGIYFSRGLDQENNFTIVLTALTAKGEYLNNGLYYSGGEICTENCLTLPNAITKK